VTDRSLFVACLNHCTEAFPFLEGVDSGTDIRNER
jgi:hypothetical protein